VEFVVKVGRGRELRDATGEVSKGVTLAAEKLGDPGHKMKQVKVPKEFPRRGGRTKFQQGKNPAWLKDSVNFRKALGAVGKVTQSEGKSDGVHRFIREGKVKGIALHGLFYSPGFCLIE
jgi:hypothetical protein